MIPCILVVSYFLALSKCFLVFSGMCSRGWVIIVLGKSVKLSRSGTRPGTPFLVLVNTCQFSPPWLALVP